jgi:hypothetical protein
LSPSRLGGDELRVQCARQPRDDFVLHVEEIGERLVEPLYQQGFRVFPAVLPASLSNMPSRASRSRGSVAERRRRKREGAGERAVWIFIGAIATATKAIEGLKLRMDLEKAFDEASFKLRKADITSNLADLKIALGEAKSEAAEKDAEYPASKTSSLSEHN